VSFERCSFRSFLHRRTAIPVVVEKDQRRGYVFNNEDFIVLRLKHPLQDCNAFAVSEPDTPLHEGDQVFSATANQIHTLNRLSNREPVLARGTIKRTFTGQVFGGPPFYHADIDLDEGGSGGAVFTLADGRPVADDGGRLILRGILVGFGLNAKNGAPYSDERNFTIVVGLQADFWDVVKGKAGMPVLAAPSPCLCPQGGTAKIEVIAEPAPPPSDTLPPLLPQNACSETAPNGETGKANASCTELAKEMAELAKALKPAAVRRGKEKQQFKLANATGCPICFTYQRCNDYGCWDEAARLGGQSTLYAGVGARAPVIKNPQFCQSLQIEPLLSPETQANEPGSSPPRPARKPQAPASASETCVAASDLDAKFMAAKEKAEREGVHTLTSEDIRGLTLDQIRQLRGY